MSTTKQPVGTRTALTVTGLATLASATYVASAAYDNTTNQPLDVLVEVAVTPGSTPSGNKQVVVFAIASLDGTNYQSGPTSGTTTTDEPQLQFIGVVPVSTSGQIATRIFSIAAAYGALPKFFKVVLKNDLGVALSAGTVNTAEVSSTST